MDYTISFFYFDKPFLYFFGPQVLKSRHRRSDSAFARPVPEARAPWQILPSVFHTNPHAAEAQ